MRIEHSVTTHLVDPVDVDDGHERAASEVGVAHYDHPRPMRSAPTSRRPCRSCVAADRFRFANHLRRCDRRRRRRHDHRGRVPAGGRIGATTLRVGHRASRVAAVSLPDRQAEPEVGDGWVRFTQTAGGRTGVPDAADRSAGRRSSSTGAPTAWSTLELTMLRRRPHEHRLVGASHVPPPLGLRHRRQARGQDRADRHPRTGPAHAFGKHTPWGDEDSPALVTAVETALERELPTSSCGAARAPDPPLTHGRRAHPARRSRRRAVPAARRGARRRCRRRALGRGRPGRRAGRAGVARGRPPDLDAARPHSLPGRGGARRADRSGEAGRAGGGPSTGAVR